MLSVKLVDFINPHPKGTPLYLEYERCVVLQLIGTSQSTTKGDSACFIRSHGTYHSEDIVVDEDNTKLFKTWAKGKGYTIVGSSTTPMALDENNQPVAVCYFGDFMAKDEETAKALIPEAGLKLADQNPLTAFRLTYDGGAGTVDSCGYEIDDEPVCLAPELYPYIEGGPEKLIADFRKSKSKIMIFIGDPGTGKSSLIRYMVKEFKTVYIGDDPILFTPGVIAKTAEEMLRSEKDELMVFEEIDSVIAPRKDEPNHLIPAILSATSGVITMGGKLVIVSNIETTKHIDAALMRSSRCFKIVHFTKLSQEEANKAAKALGLPKPTGKTHYALSEITAGLNPGNAKSIGFN